MNKKENGLTNLVVIIMSLILSAMSALMIFVKGVAIEYLLYVICSAGVIVGIVMIVRYFMKDAYRNVNAYGFSIGTLFVILGICGLLRASELAGAFLIILGIILLLAGIIMLQHSLDLYRMKDFLRIPTMILAIAALICAIMAILQPVKKSINYSQVIWWMILVVGTLSLIINLYTLTKVKMFDKKEKKQAEKEADQSTEPVDNEVTENTEIAEADNSNSLEVDAAEAIEAAEGDSSSNTDTNTDEQPGEGSSKEEI